MGKAIRHLLPVSECLRMLEFRALGNMACRHMLDTGLTGIVYLEAINAQQSAHTTLLMQLRPLAVKTFPAAGLHWILGLHSCKKVLRTSLTCALGMQMCQTSHTHQDHCQNCDHCLLSLQPTCKASCVRILTSIFCQIRLLGLSWLLGIACVQECKLSSTCHKNIFDA